MKPCLLLAGLGLVCSGQGHAAFIDYTRWLDLQDSTVAVAGSSSSVVIDGRHYERFDMELNANPDRHVDASPGNEQIRFNYRLNARFSEGAALTTFSSTPMTVYARYSQWDPQFVWEGGYRHLLPGAIENRASLSITDGTCDPEGFICWGWGQLPGYEYQWPGLAQPVGTFASLADIDLSVFATSVIYGPDNGPENDALSLGAPQIKLSFLAPVSAVPEPSVYAMMGLGLVTLMLGRRRRR
ncbi:PEP-CTERM sorting domain-containing protein [Chitinolyticbacter albus]|uniref:PEP-CTERM sorting domain-containing protein n=1 Tax=Chitinolyticbacter albus TaxID=2961951 RepID=UPI00210B697D|nr:PEP-CTERM sorting domain-containing protein [Chitinolyticbacter albus]